MRLPSLCLIALLSLSAASQDTPDARVKRVLDDPKFKAAMAVLDREHDRIVADIVTLTEIPAPPFKEDKRGAAYLEMLRQHGLTDVERDAEGNVMGVRKGTGSGPLIAIAAHLDTVFPEGTDVKVKREGTRLSAPGIGDDTRSLAVLLGDHPRAWTPPASHTASDILFIGNVGEEGPGRPARRETPLPERPVQRSHRDVHLDGRRRWRRRHHHTAAWAASGIA